MISTKIHQFLTKNKKVFYYLWFFLVIFSIWIDSTFAATSSESEREMMESIATIVNGLLMWISVLLGLITYLVTMFLSPEWTNGSLFGLNVYFKNIWILVSNIVYFIFAFILIWIAFMNIIWKSSDQFQLKQALPKFTIWVLIVPLSWFFVQFVLSITSILTIWALTLPFNTFPAFDENVWGIDVPKSCTLDLTSFSDGWADWAKEYMTCDDTNLIKLSALIDWGDAYDSIFWVISLYTYWVLWFDRIDDVNLIDLTNIRTLGDLIVKIIFDLLFVFIYAILMIALWMVLMIRWIYLWIFTMLSPIFWLMFFFDKTNWWDDNFFGKFNIGKFLSLAMVPVYSMLALSFWMLFIYITWTWMAAWPSTATATHPTKITVAEDKLSVWQFDLIIKWSVSSSYNITNFIQKMWWDALWVIWTLILKVFGIIVLWWAVMAALRSSDITKVIVQPLHDFWNKVWQIAASAPANIPVFGGATMKGLSEAASTVQSNINRTSAASWAWLASKFWGGNDFHTALNEHRQATWVEARKNALDHAIKVSSTKNVTEMNEIKKLMKDVFEKDLEITASMSDEQKWKAFIDFIKTIDDKTGIDTVEYKNSQRIIAKMNWNPSVPAPSTDTWNNDNIIEKTANSTVKIDVWNTKVEVNIDSNNNVSDQDKDEVLSQVLASLKTKETSTDANTILETFRNKTDILKEYSNIDETKKLYYDKSKNKFSSTEVNGDYVKIDTEEQLTKAINWEAI